MVQSSTDLKDKYLRDEMFPTIFCPGCGIGNILNYVVQAIDQLQLDMKDMVFVSGIGCSSRMPAYFKGSSLHTLHGRALAYATGVKLVNPDLQVVVFTGDGDCGSIGGNHFLHSIRRNLDITVIAVNNNIYGMTGGQHSPTTPRGSRTTSTPYGSHEYPLDLSRLALVLGAPYVARWTTAHPMQSINAIKKGLSKKGFSFIELMSPCPTGYGRRNKLGDAAAMTKWYKDNTSRYNEQGGDKSIAEFREDFKDNIVIGEFMDKDKPTFTDLWRQLCKKAQESRK